LFFEFYKEFVRITIVECVDEFLDVIAFTILEQGLDRVLALMGTLDFEDGLQLPRGRFLTLIPSVILVLGVAATLPRSIVLCHCCHRRCRGGGVFVLCRETLVILIKMSYSLWT
jgi:hypothetical protein